MGFFRIVFFLSVSRDVKNISFGIKDDSRKALSCPGSSALRFWSIYLLGGGPSFFESLLKLSLRALGWSLSTGYLKKVSALLHSSQIKENIIGLQSIPHFFLSPSSSVSLTFSPEAGNWDSHTAQYCIPRDKGGYGALLRWSYKIVPKLPSPRESCLVWWFGPTNIPGGTPLNAGCSQKDQFDPLSLICTVGKKGIKGIKM